MPASGGAPAARGFARDVLELQGRYEEAMQEYMRVIEEAQKLGNRGSEALGMLGLGRVNAAIGRIENARARSISSSNSHSSRDSDSSGNNNAPVRITLFKMQNIPPTDANVLASPLVRFRSTSIVLKEKDQALAIARDIGQI